jgi:DDE superfamily endonuclease
MPFDLARWRQMVRHDIERFAADPVQALHVAGVASLYGFLLGSAIFPVAVAYSLDPQSALATLMGVIGGVGSNLVANWVQSKYDKVRTYTVAVEESQQPQLAPIYDAIAKEVEIFPLADQALRQAGYSTMIERLHTELQQYGKLDQYLGQPPPFQQTGTLILQRRVRNGCSELAIKWTWYPRLNSLPPELSKDAMPPTIVADTCPAPSCNLSPRDVEALSMHLETYATQFLHTFARADQAQWAYRYLRGLLSDLPRKSIEPIALAFGLKIRAMQAFISESPWESTPVLHTHQQVVAQTLGEDDGVLLVDESGLPKQGGHSVGVAPQYCGALGKIANCQVGVYVGYASRRGYTLLSGQLFVPECWFADPHATLREAVGMPSDLTFLTKPQLALQLVQAIVERRTVPVRWVAADALYGDSPAFRDAIADLGLWYFTEVACSTLIWRRHPALIVPPWSGKG